MKLRCASSAINTWLVVHRTRFSKRMKACPICSRTYADDTLAFCLDDGATLSASFNPVSGVRGDRPRDAGPPPTEVLPAGPLIPPAFRPTRPAFTASVYPAGAPRARKGTQWIILIGTLALGLIAFVIVVGYVAWKATSTPRPQQYSSAPTNANRESQSKPPEESTLSWLDGRWEGEGYQTDTKTTWAVRLTVQDGTYSVEYPNIPCSGKWTMLDKSSVGASFTEVISKGTNLCDTNSHVMLEKINDSEISCRYSHEGSRSVIATATLSKKAQATGPR